MGTTGSLLIGDALKRCVRHSNQVGSRFVVLDAISDNAAKLYANFDFVPVPSVPGRIVVATAKLRATEAEGLKRQSQKAAEDAAS